MPNLSLNELRLLETAPELLRAVDLMPARLTARHVVATQSGRPVFLPQLPVEPSDAVCQKCGKPMVVKRGKYGDFLACSGFPGCKNTTSFGTNGIARETGAPCPEKNCDGALVQRKSKRGKVFYGCNRFPTCNFATWDKPVAERCPECGANILVEKSTKKKGAFLGCLTAGCGYQKNLKPPSSDQGK